MAKKILGLDLGSNSIAWVLLEEKAGNIVRIIDIGCKVINKSVNDKPPFSPKNVKRRNARLVRKVTKRRNRRTAKLLNLLVRLDLLPNVLTESAQPEIIFNTLGDPNLLRAKALDDELTQYELGRVFYHLVQRRGFLSNRKGLCGDMVDDPDVLDALAELEAEEEVGQNLSVEQKKEETLFKQQIDGLREKISASGCRTLGEYLARQDAHQCQRNRASQNGSLRTDRKMYQDEFQAIWNKQREYHSILTDENREKIHKILFFQRPIKLRADRVGKCSLEKQKNRARMARLEVQKFRYLQDINNLTYETNDGNYRSLDSEQKQLAVAFFESHSKIKVSELKKALGIRARDKLNLDAKQLKGNSTACKIRAVLTNWDQLDQTEQKRLVEDLITISKKSVLKKRLIQHWRLPSDQAVQLCLLEFEPGHSNHSTKAISKLLPYLQQGMRYAEARMAAGYGYEVEPITLTEQLPIPPVTGNPIVNSALTNLRRLVNRLIKQYGQIDSIRIEMARDLEKNTKRYAADMKTQKENKRKNQEAVEAYQAIRKANRGLGLPEYPSREDKLKYRLWQDQEHKCIYSGRQISQTALFTAEIEIDHILPWSQSLDNSYMNRVVCYAAENRYKGQRVPCEAYAGEQWKQITSRINDWNWGKGKRKNLASKKMRFYKTSDELISERDFTSSQLNDTRYISRLALEYLTKLVGKHHVTATKGQLVSWLRYQWGFNRMLNHTNEKSRDDHRHHIIDAVVIGCINRTLHKQLINHIKQAEERQSEFNFTDVSIPLPYDSIYAELEEKLNTVIISHSPQRKISGALHEETGIGVIIDAYKKPTKKNNSHKRKVKCVQRKTLDAQIKGEKINKIIDPVVARLVEVHLANYDGDSKKAFADDNTLYHKDGVTPIRRVRMQQSAAVTREKLAQSKLGIKNKHGEVFKWYLYGNNHHVEVIRHIKTGQVSGKFITMFDAAKRARGINGLKTAIIQRDHGEDYEFLMALHIDDLVSIQVNNQRIFYRVQKLEAAIKGVKLRLHTAANIDNDDESVMIRFNDKFHSWQLKKHKINAIGKLLND